VVDRTILKLRRKDPSKTSCDRCDLTAQYCRQVGPQPRRIAAAAADLVFSVLVLLTDIQPLFTPSLVNPRTLIGITARPAVATLEHAGSSLGSGTVAIEPRGGRLMTPTYDPPRCVLVEQRR